MNGRWPWSGRSRNAAFPKNDCSNWAEHKKERKEQPLSNCRRRKRPRSNRETIKREKRPNQRLTKETGHIPMKYICLGYIAPNNFEKLPENERNAMMDECFTYDDVLRKNGHFAGGEALQSAHTATTLRWKDGKVSITDGPYAETKEQLGGILVLEARDLNHAIQ